MDKKDVLDIYREQFSFEMDRKKDITSQAQVRFALIAAGATLLVYMARNVDLNTNQSTLIFFTILSVISAVLFASATYKLADAFWGNTYTYLPPMNETERYRRDLELQESDSVEQFEDYLIDEYSECAGDNRKTNNNRQQKMNSIVKLLQASLIPFTLVGGIFLLLDLDASSSRKSIDVQLVGFEQPKGDAIEVSGDKNDK